MIYNKSKFMSKFLSTLRQASSFPLLGASRKRSASLNFGIKNDGGISSVIFCAGLCRRKKQTCYGNVKLNDLDWLLLDTSEMLDKS